MLPSRSEKCPGVVTVFAVARPVEPRRDARTVVSAADAGPHVREQVRERARALQPPELRAAISEQLPKLARGHQEGKPVADTEARILHAIRGVDRARRLLAGRIAHLRQLRDGLLSDR